MLVMLAFHVCARALFRTTDGFCNQVNFAPFFVAAPGNATVATVADHVEHVATVAGKDQCVYYH